MIRSFAVGVVTVAILILVTPAGRLQAQSGKPIPNHVPVEFTGGTSGLRLELFINNGKVGETTVDAQGGASSFLDFSNMGKAQVQIYVDVCQDGQMMKVLVVAGQPAPEDQGCKRRLVAAAWWNDCGVTRITIDLRKFGAHIAGCGSFFTEPKGIGTLVGLVGGGFLISQAAGGSDTPVVASTPTSTSTTTTSTTTTTTTTPVTTTPTEPQTDFSVTGVLVTWEHTNPGVSSTLCGRFATSPARANAPFVVTIAGPGASQPTVSGSTNASGIGLFRGTIVSFGAYVVNVSVNAVGLTRTGSGNANVTSANSTCPSS